MKRAVRPREAAAISLRGASCACVHCMQQLRCTSHTLRFRQQQGVNGVQLASLCSCCQCFLTGRAAPGALVAGSCSCVLYIQCSSAISVSFPLPSTPMLAGVCAGLPKHPAQAAADPGHNLLLTLCQGPSGGLAGRSPQPVLYFSFTGFMAPGSSIWWNWYTWHAGRIAYAVPAPA